MSLEGLIIDGKWRVGGILGAGDCSQVHEVISSEKSAVVIKASKLGTKKQERRLADTLFQEHLVYEQICNRYPRYFARKYKYGEEFGWRYLVLERLGQQANDIDGSISHQICIIGRDIVSALELLHGGGYVYADMKPENIMIGVHGSSSNDKEARLIDFGLAQRFRAAMTGLHREGRVARIGTARFRGVEAQAHQLSPSRQNDCEALGHVLLCIANHGVLPWDTVESDETKLIAKKKELFRPQDTVAACREIDPILRAPLTEFLSISRNTPHQDTPDYAALKHCFHIDPPSTSSTKKATRRKTKPNPEAAQAPFVSTATPRVGTRRSRRTQQQAPEESHTEALPSSRRPSQTKRTKASIDLPQDTHQTGRHTATTAPTAALKPTSRENLLALARSPNPAAKRHRVPR